MNEFLSKRLHIEMRTTVQRERFLQTALERRWGWSLLLTGWLHLAAFAGCHVLKVVCDYHGGLGYMALWLGELLGMWGIFRLCGGRRETKPDEPEQFVRRLWIAYFLLAFNVVSMNSLRGHPHFEFFPALASLASFAFVMMTLLVHWRFFGAVLVMWAGGLYMAADPMDGFLIFALAWWLVLNRIGMAILAQGRQTILATGSTSAGDAIQQNTAA